MLFRQLLRSVWKRNVLTIEVSAPATSANLGPGYDSFGMALDLSDSITAVLHDETVDLNNCVKVSGEGEGQLPTTSDHLIHRVTTTILRDRGIDVGTGSRSTVSTRFLSRGDGVVGGIGGRGNFDCGRDL